jgi:hypothetical protein
MFNTTDTNTVEQDKKCQPCWYIVSINYTFSVRLITLDEGTKSVIVLEHTIPHLFRKEIEFENIQGYDDLKDIVRRGLDAEHNYNLLFTGST